MNILIILLFSVALVQGSPLKPPPLGTATDKLEGFPWIKASKAKAKFGTTPASHLGEATTTISPPVISAQNLPFVLTQQMLEDYISAIRTFLQPYVVPTDADNSPTTAEPKSLITANSDFTPAKRPLKAKVPKAIDPSNVPPPTTENYWDAERKMYPDSFYDEFYLDWLRKRQVEESPGTTPNPPVTDESTEATDLSNPQQQVPPTVSPFPTVPLTFNPYLMNPFVYPLAGMKVSKVLAQAQVSAALAALNITTTAKPIKIKLKIPIPPGSDLAQVVSSGIAGFPAGTTYVLNKK